MILVSLLAAFSHLSVTAATLSSEPSNAIDSSKNVKEAPETIIRNKLAQLDKTSPVKLDFNAEVLRHIEAYVGSRRQELAKFIGLSKIYFPIFEEILDRYDLPLELKYLTIIESGLNPLAVSKSGATGLWQFLLNTANLFDLKVTSYVDERRDPYKSTEAACRYMTYLYNTFHDWHLVLAAYNGGSGEVRKAIERNNGETNYWKIRASLSEQARNYVPLFIAMVYLMNTYEDYGIIPMEPSFDFYSLDTLHISYSLSFEQIAAMTDLSVEKIRYFNPTYKRNFIPETDPWSVLVLPSDKIAEFLRNESDVFSFTTRSIDYNQVVENAIQTAGKIQIVHEVKSGEYPHMIAIKYNCILEQLKAWNNLSDNDSIYPGQKLVIWVNPGTNIQN